MRSTWIVLVLMVLMVRPVGAQETGQVGLTMAYPASVGLVWHAADRMAVRPELTFNRNTTDITSTLTITIGGQTQTMQNVSSATGTAIGTGVSGLFYVSKRDGLSVYLSPRYTYSRLSTTSSGTAALSTMATTHGVSGSVGAQYAMGRRFSVFGEVGLGYTKGGSDAPSLQNDSLSGVLSTSSRSEVSSHSVGIRSGVGVVLYF